MMMKKNFLLFSLVAMVLCATSCSESGLGEERMDRFRQEVLPNDAYMQVMDEFGRFDDDVYAAQLDEVYQAESRKIAETDRMAAWFFGSDIMKGLDGDQKTVRRLYENLGESFLTLGHDVVEQVKSNPDSVKNILDAIVKTYQGVAVPDSLKDVCGTYPFSELVCEASQASQVADKLKSIGADMWKANLRQTFELAIKDNNGWVIDNRKLAAKDAKNRSQSNVIFRYVLAVVVRDAIVEAQKGQEILYIHQNEENENVFEVGLSSKNAYRLAFDEGGHMVYKQVGFNELYMGEGVGK